MEIGSRTISFRVAVLLIIVTISSLSFTIAGAIAKYVMVKPYVANIVFDEANLNRSICCSDEKEIPEKVREKVLVKLGHRPGGRGNVVMTRLNDDLKKTDSLVEVEVFTSRSEAAAFFIKEGIQARTDLVEKVMPTVEKIRELRKQARESLGKVQEEDSETSTSEEV